MSYFQGLVSPTNLENARKKQAGKQRTWFTLTVDGLNFVLYQVISSSIIIVSLIILQGILGNDFLNGLGIVG